MRRPKNLKKSPTCFDKTAVFTQQGQSKLEIFQNVCGLLRKAELYQNNFLRYNTIFVLLEVECAKKKDHCGITYVNWISNLYCTSTHCINTKASMLHFTQIVNSPSLHLNTHQSLQTFKMKIFIQKFAIYIEVCTQLQQN